MKKFIFILIILLIPKAYADLLNSTYVSPESYAVNEADLTDYMYIAPPSKINIDTLDEMRFPNNQNPQLSSDNSDNTTVSTKTKKSKKSKKEFDEEEYKKHLPYKVAKWWVDQRYKREEPHHGQLHEIKVQQRLDYEKKLEEAKEGG